MSQDTNLQDYTLGVTLSELLWKELFWERFNVKLVPEFVANKEPKQHGFSSHLQGFLQSLKQNTSQVQKQSYAKRHIYVVSYGMNTGSEINGDRPSIVYKATHSTFWDDVIVIPLTSAVAQKLADAYDVFVPKDANNKLFQNSYARLRQIRSVSVKRVGRKIGELSNPEVQKAINEGIKKMLATDK